MHCVKRASKCSPKNLELQALRSEPQFPCFLHPHKIVGMYDQQLLTLWKLETPLNLRGKLQRLLYTDTEILSPWSKNAKIKTTLRPSCLAESMLWMSLDSRTHLHSTVWDTFTSIQLSVPLSGLKRGRRLSSQLNP